MTLEEFKTALKTKEDGVNEAERMLREKQHDMNSFLMENLGQGNGSQATLSGLVEMIEKVMEMKNGK